MSKAQIQLPTFVALRLFSFAKRKCHENDLWKGAVPEVLAGHGDLMPLSKKNKTNFSRNKDDDVC